MLLDCTVSCVVPAALPCSLTGPVLSGQAACQLESRLGARLLDRPRPLPLQSGGSGLCLSLEDLSLGWRCRSPAVQQVSPQIQRRDTHHPLRYGAGTPTAH